MIFIDTNIFLYAVDRKSVEHKVCASYLAQCQANVSPWYTSWNVIYEFLRVATHKKVFTAPLTLKQAWQFIEALLKCKNFKILCPQDNHSAIFGELVHLYPLLAGNILFDLRNVALLREHGIKNICTRDMDYHRFDFLNIINPVD